MGSEPGNDLTSPAAEAPMVNTVNAQEDFGDLELATAFQTEPRNGKQKERAPSPLEPNMENVHEPDENLRRLDTLEQNVSELLQCEYSQCFNLKFSTDATLLRHQREAHMAPGHKRFPCLYQQCDQAAKAFPRK
jgi:hypothetical protein